MDTDIRILEANPYFSEEKPRAPLKFGAVVMKEVTYCQVQVKVENKKGNKANGYGGMFLSDVWAFPTFSILHEDKDRAMRLITQRFSLLVGGYKKFAHPVEIFMELEGDLKRIVKDVAKELSFKEEVPFLAGLVSASPVDAAVHDAFGNVNKISSYDGYGREFMGHDLSDWLGKEFKGKYISDYIRKWYLREIPVFHLVGGLDKLREDEVDEKDPKDGLPNSLEKWIERDGLFCLKVKLRGNDAIWDVNRFIEVVKIAHSTNKKSNEFYFTADTNEQCRSPEYMIDFLMKLKENYPIAFNELLYVEQPTERDLRLHRFDMGKLAKLKPVIIDESLTTFEDYELSMELGWSGIALKACKCQSASLLFLSKATEDKIPYAVQDLTNPGIALIQSAGFAARIYTMKGVEANSHQFYPDTSMIESKVHPGIFRRKDGKLNLQTLQGYGLGYQMERIGRRFE